MHTKLSIIALAVTSVISSSVFAVQWEDPSADAQKITSTNHKDLFVEKIDKEIDFTANIQKGQPGEHVQAYSTVQADQTSTNIERNALWVTNKTNGANASAFQINGGGVAINNGKIFLKGETGNFERTHGFAIQDGTAINNGIVVADSAVGMIINSSGSGTITNGKNGEISAINGGAAMEIGKKLNTDNALISNEGIITADDTSVGILATTDDYITVDNSGYISGKNAIYISAENSTLRLKEGSNIDGTVSLVDGTSLKVDNVTDTLTLANTDISDSSLDLGKSRIDSSNLTLDYKGSINFSNVRMNEADLSLTAGTHVTIKNLQNVEYVDGSKGTGSVNFNLNELGQATIEQAEADIKVGTTFTNGDIADAYAAGKLTTEEIIAGSAQANLDQSQNAGILARGGLLSGDVAISANGNVTTTANGFTTANMDLAKLNAVAWRNELNTLTDRMSTLRTAPEFAGTWVRYKGGEWDGDGINQQFNGVELGVDKTIGQNFLVGLSASYINGDGDLDNGSADTDNYSGAAYLSYFNSGWFVDVMGKIGKIETDFDLSYNGLKDSGNYTMSGYLVGVETGYRFNFNNFFVEPQVQLTYSYLGGKEFSTDNRTIDFETIESMIGRVSFMSGYDFGDIGSAYLRASYYHDFDGDVDMRVGHNDLFVTESDELDSDWGDVGVGANVTFGGATLFFDVSRSYGGDIDMEWKANAGARYSF